MSETSTNSLNINMIYNLLENKKIIDINVPLLLSKYNFNLDNINNLNPNKLISNFKYLKKFIDQGYMTYESPEIIGKIIGKKIEMLDKISNKMKFKKIEAPSYSSRTPLYIGVGNSTTLEVNCTMDKFGIPYIPGSSLKGMLSHKFMYDLFEKYNDNESIKDILENEGINKFSKILKFDEKEIMKRKKKNPEIVDFFKYEDVIMFRWLFGTNDNAGNLIIFDAYPEQFKITNDIINVHYQKYYSGEEYPIDFYNPILIYTYAFMLKKLHLYIFLKNENIPSNITQYIVKIKEYIINLFEIDGIGAKTSLGFGIFKRDQ